MTDVVVHPVPTADGGYYVWVAGDERGQAPTRDEAFAAGLRAFEARRALERSQSVTFWDRIRQAHVRIGRRR